MSFQNYPKYCNLQKPKADDQGTIKIVATNELGSHQVQQNFQLTCVGKDIFKSVDSYFKR
jgi:hypothetical protein